MSCFIPRFPTYLVCFSLLFHGCRPREFYKNASPTFMSIDSLTLDVDAKTQHAQSGQVKDGHESKKRYCMLHETFKKGVPSKKPFSRLVPNFKVKHTSRCSFVDLSELFHDTCLGHARWACSKHRPSRWIWQGNLDSTSNIRKKKSGCQSPKM